MVRLIGSALALLALLACEQESYAPAIALTAPMADAAESEMITVTGSVVRKGSLDAAAEPASSEGDPGGERRFLAYEYGVDMLLPADKVGVLLSQHEKACMEAGPDVCIVTGRSIFEETEDDVSGELFFSASRSFMDPFRAGLAEQAEAANGTITSETAEVEDLTRQMVDTQANLTAQKKLRERLLVLLEREDGQLRDLLQVERELARVQGQIESTESYLRVLQGRVNRDTMELRYDSIREAVTPSTFSPLSNAIRSVLSIVAESLAAVIMFIAAALPWLIVIIPGIWIFRRLVRSFFSRS